MSDHTPTPARALEMIERWARDRHLHLHVNAQNGAGAVFSRCGRYRYLLWRRPFKGRHRSVRRFRARPDARRKSSCRGRAIMRPHSPARWSSQELAILADVSTAGRPEVTGAQLASKIRRRAIQLDLPIWVFVRKISPHPQKWLNQLTNAGRPKPHTIARVQALLDGAPVPPPPPNGFQAPARRGESCREPLVIVRKLDESTTPEPIVSDPCFSCGVRADRHAVSGCRRWTPRG